MEYTNPIFMNMPLVSVVMPLFNAEKYVGDAVESVLSQSYTNFELIIVNDASTDKSAACVQGIVDRRIVIVENENNLGIVASRNRGLALAKGKYIAILDSDDIALPNRLEKQVAFLEANPEYGICGSYYHVINGLGKKILSFKVPVSSADNKTFLLFNVPFCHSTIMMPTALAQSLAYKEGFDIIEDYEIAHRISKKFKIGNLPEYTTLYRVHGNNISISKLNKMREVRRKLDAQILEDLQIYFSDNELDLHSNFINGCYDYFEDEEKMEDLEHWLIRLYSFVKQQPNYNMVFLRKMISVRWWNLCVQTNNWTFLWNTTLLSEFSGFYFINNFKQLTSRFLKQMDVI
jgi:glycosyltransferase involved in cell wall biosynthesis